MWLFHLDWPFRNTSLTELKWTQALPLMYWSDYNSCYMRTSAHVQCAKYTRIQLIGIRVDWKEERGSNSSAETAHSLLIFRYRRCRRFWKNQTGSSGPEWPVDWVPFSKLWSNFTRLWIWWNLISFNFMEIRRRSVDHRVCWTCTSRLHQ